MAEARRGGDPAHGTERFPAFAAEAIRLNVDVIVAANDAGARAAQKLTRTIPIVVAIMGDPVGSGFVASLAGREETSRG